MARELWETADDVEERVLRGIRNPSELLFDSEDVVDALENALLTFDRVKPLTKFVSIPLKQGKGSYSIPRYWDSENEELKEEDDDSDEIRLVLDVLGFVGVINDSIQMYETIPHEESSLGVTDLTRHGNRSITVIDEINQSFWRERDEFDGFRFDEDNFELKVYPTPRVSGVGVAEVKIKRELSDIPDKYKGAYIDLAIAEAADILSVNYTVIESSPTPAGSVSYNTEGLKKLAEDRREKAMKKIGVDGTVIQIG